MPARSWNCTSSTVSRRRRRPRNRWLDHPGYFRILAFPHVDARPEDDLSFAAQRLAERAEAGVRRVASIIELGVKTGAARPVDPYRAAKFMWGAWTGVIALNLRPDRLRLDDDELRAVLDEGRRIVAEGIASMALRQPDGTLRPEFDMAPAASRHPRSDPQRSEKMRFGIFYEHQLPRPWAEGAEEKLLNDALDQVELADRLGIDYVWEVEHHFLEEYSHSSAPEVFLAAAQPAHQAHPARPRHRAAPAAASTIRRASPSAIATLDLISGGRVEFGTGESSSRRRSSAASASTASSKREQWEEALDAITRMFVEEPFAGYDGRVRRCRRATWCRSRSRSRTRRCGSRAAGARRSCSPRARASARSRSRSSSPRRRKRVGRRVLLASSQSDECVPAGFAVNPNFAVVLPMMCHEDEQTAIERGIDGAHFFGYSLAHYYVFGEHRPGVTNVWEEFQANRADYGFAREIINADERAARA